MTTTELRRRVSQRIRKLSPEHLRVAEDFLAYLADRQDNPATRELLRIPGFARALTKAERQASSGHMLSLSKVRRDV